MLRSVLRAHLAMTMASLLLACGGPHEPVTVSFSIAEIECQEELGACGIEQHTRGIVAESFEPGPDELSEESGERILYADFPAPKEGLAIIEISQPRSGVAKVRYREVYRGEVSFAGAITSQDVELAFGDDGAPMLYGRFEFTATDVERGTTRRVHSGRVLAVASSPDSVGPRVPGPSPTRVPAPAPEVPEEKDVPIQSVSFPRGSEVSVVVVETAHGCSDPAPETSGCEDPTPSSGGGCSSDTAASGCEADSFDSSGCDDASSAGCEADSFDAGGCDNCSANRPTQRLNLVHAIWRLFWPVLLVGGLNRWTRRRLSLQAPCEPVDL